MKFEAILTGALAFALGMFIFQIAAPVLDDVVG